MLDVDFVKISGRACHYDYRRLLENVRSLGEAMNKCWDDENCKGIMEMPCDETDVHSRRKRSTTDYFLCYVGYGYGDSLENCVYEKTGNFFYGNNFLSSKQYKFYGRIKLYIGRNLFLH